MEKFHDDILRKFANHLPCVADRDDATDVCKKWRAALAEPLPGPPLPRQLPWLLLPSDDTTTRVCCLFCGNDGCALRHKVKGTQGARYFGSYKGSWLFVARDQIRGHGMMNIRAPPVDRKVHYIPFPDFLAPSRCNMVILAATLSSPPNERKGTLLSPPNEKKCIGAGIIIQWQLIPGQRQAAFWTMGDSLAISVDPDVCQPPLEVVDLLYHDGKFHFLTEDGHIRVYTPVFNLSGDLENLSTSVCLFQDMEHDLRVKARYLVQSRGTLLMVVRYGNFLGVTDFKIFKMTSEHVTRDGVNNVVHTWSELNSLDGRMFFVGRGCSQSYEVSTYVERGLDEGIYFTDDECFYDPAMLLRGMNDRKYLCAANGKWSQWRIHKVKRCFPAQEPSKSSPPVWLIP